MKEVNWRGLLFSILILALASGLSYLGLNQVSTSKDEPHAMRMSIALVNEDEGAHFKDNNIAFGDEFIKSIDRDSTHNWYVVSRGVAENGYERNDYNMMIVIPNDFSEKAISIESDSPDPVVLNYKINASGHENIKAEAEKTASQILNDFNRRIIDVYFASVIGNLQDAQDNISAIVEKEAMYTNTYNDSINSPLSNYTSQFEAIQDNTTRSKDSFNSLEEILEVFENELNEDVKVNKSYFSNVSDLAQLKEQNSLFLLSYAEQFSKFIDEMNSSDVSSQNEELKRNNKFIYDQFKEREDEASDGESRNIVSYADVIKRNLSPVKREVAGLIKYLGLTDNEEDGDEEDKTLLMDLEDRVEERLSEAFEGGFDELSDFFVRLDEGVQEHHIQSQINRLPSLNVNDIDNLSEDTKKELKNVILVTNQYIKEHDYSKPEDDNSLMLATLINEIKEKLIDGVTVSKTVKLKEGTKNDSHFYLNGPDGFEVSQLSIYYANGSKEIDNYQSGDLLSLPPINEGDFTVELKLKLLEGQNDYEEIDVFKPVAWDWKLHQENTTGEDLSTNSHEIVSSQNKENSEVNNTEDIEESLDDSETAMEIDHNSEIVNDSNKKLNHINEDEEALEEEEKQKNNLEEASEEDPEIITVEIINNSLYHSVMSPLDDQLVGDNPTEKLIEVVANTVSEYQRMLSLYEAYYGLGMESDSLEDEIKSLGEGKTLKDLAEEKYNYKDSLHYVFNGTDISELLKDFVVEDVTEKIMKQIRVPIKNLKRDVSEHERLVNIIDQNSDLLGERLSRTSEAAEKMNVDLTETLANIEAWRDRSLDLVNEQNEVFANENEEQSVVMTLDGDFQPLLMSSESLASQAQGNLSTAKTVYQTFEALDNQAMTIQQSGVNLVTEAEDLSLKMTDKLMENQEFSDNFANVLANSRVGDRQNESLYDFLSNPVKTENDGTIIAGDTFTPYFLVLILSIVALFTAYVISTHNQRRIDEDPFEAEKTLIGKNTPLALIIAGIGLVEGIVIGVLSGYLLSISQSHIVTWTIMITLTMVTMLFITTYLLRQLKMIGMFILLIIFSLYLFFTEALGFGFDKVSFVEKLRMFSPLQHVETLLNTTAISLANNESLILTFFILIIILLISFIANLFVLSRSSNKEEVDDEALAEAN